MKPNYELRPYTLVYIADKESEVLQPESLVLICPGKLQGDIVRRLDIGSLCYTRRGKKSNREDVRYVDLSSLDRKRTPFSERLAEYLRSFMGSPTSLIEYFHKYKIFVDWIDQQERYYDFDSNDDMVAAYQGYTRYLYHRMNESGISQKPLKQRSAARYQSCAAQVVMCATGLSELEIKARANVILQLKTRNIPVLPQSEEVQARTFATLVQFIEEIHRVVIDCQPLPACFTSPNGDSYYYYSSFQDAPTRKNEKLPVRELFGKQSAFPSWEEFKDYFGLFGTNEELIISRKSFDEARQRYDSRNSNLRHSEREALARYSIIAGMLAFVAATGVNLDTAQQLEINTMRIVSSTKGKRFSGTKGRASGKSINPEFGVEFIPVFKKIIALREWILNGVPSNLVFPRFNAEKNIAAIGQTEIIAFKKRFAVYFPNTSWVTPTQWRKNVSYQYVKLSRGDLHLESEKLGHTVRTAEKRYARASFEDAARELTDYLQAMHQSAIDRTRSIEHIPVKIGDESLPETPAGHCDAQKGQAPSLAEGFTRNAIAPACGQPESCLFCTYYAVHADAQDIRRLLSLRYVMLQVKPRAKDHEHWERDFGPILHRVDEVLEALKSQGRNINCMVKRIRGEVEYGDLDPFWANHFEFLAEMGWVS